MGPAPDRHQPGGRQSGRAGQAPGRGLAAGQGFLKMARFKPSVTVAAVIEHQGRYLLVEEETPEGLMLNNPAGHLEEGESPLEAVVREALEEAARDFHPEFFLGAYLARVQRPGDDVTYLRLAFGGSVGEQIAGRVLDEGIRPHAVAQRRRDQGQCRATPQPARAAMRGRPPGRAAPAAGGGPCPCLGQDRTLNLEMSAPSKCLLLLRRRNGFSDRPVRTADGGPMPPCASPPGTAARTR